MALIQFQMFMIIMSLDIQLLEVLSLAQALLLMNKFFCTIKAQRTSQVDLWFTFTTNDQSKPWAHVDSLFVPVSPLTCTICKKRTLWPVESLFAVVCPLMCAMNLMHHTGFVCSYLVIMTLGDLDKQGDYTSYLALTRPINC